MGGFEKNLCEDNDSWNNKRKIHGILEKILGGDHHHFVDILQYV